MSLLSGLTCYALWKKQTAFGTKASLASAAKIASPIPEGTLIRPRPYRLPKNDHVLAQQRSTDLYNIPKLADFQASFFLYQDDLMVDWFVSAFGQEVRTGAVAPFTHKWYINNPIYDGGSDPGSGAGTYWGRALTFHWAHRGPTGSGSDFIGFEIESAVVQQLQLTFEQSQLARLMVSGVGANYMRATPAAAFSYPVAAPFGWDHLQTAAGPPTAGIWMTSGASPTAPAQGSNEIVISKMTFNLNNNLLIQPQLGLSSSNYFRKPDRDNYPEMTVEIEGLADANTGGSTFNAISAVDSFINAEFVNLDAKASVSANSILECSFTRAAAGGAGVLDPPEISYNGEGIMRFRTRMNVMPATSSTDAFIQLTAATS